MKDYASGEELIAEIRKRAELFIAEFDDVPASELPLPGTGGTDSAISTAPSTSSGVTPPCPGFRRPFGTGATTSSPSWHR